MNVDTTALTAAISSAAGAAISLACAYIPGLKQRFDALPGDQKRMWMGIAILAIAVGVGAISCVNIVDIVPCSKDGLVLLVVALFSALTGNQSAYSLAVKDRVK
jgi:hypothetical protein